PPSPPKPPTHLGWACPGGHSRVPGEHRGSSTLAPWPLAVLLLLGGGRLHGHRGDAGGEALLIALGLALLVAGLQALHLALAEAQLAAALAARLRAPRL